MVVMSIVAIVFTFSVSGMISAGRDTELRHAAKELQSDIRQIANNSITVSSATDPDAAGAPSKAWAIRIDNGWPGTITFDYYGDGPICEFAWCEPPSGTRTTFTSPEVSKQDTPNITNEYAIKTTKTAGNWEIGKGVSLALVFSAPFGEFKSLPAWSIDLWEEDSRTHVITPWQDPTDTSINIIIDSIFIRVSDEYDNSLYLKINHITGETSVLNSKPSEWPG